MKSEGYKWIKIYNSFDEAKSAISNQKIIKKLINEQWICLTRVDETIFGFDETCPHQGALY